MSASTPSDGDDDDPDNPCCKIGRGIERYDRSDLDDRLVEEYTIEGGSLRSLEQTVNEAFMRGVLDTVDADTVQKLNSTATSNPPDLVDILTGDNKRQQARVETILQQADVVVDQLKRDFVSYRTVKKHLNQCLNVDTSRKAPDPITTTDAEDTIEWAETRCERVINRTIERLANTNDGLPTNVSVDTTTRITCNDCGTTEPVTAFIRNGCDCTK